MQVVTEDKVGIDSSIFAAAALAGNCLGVSLTTWLFEVYAQNISLSLFICGTLCLLAAILCHYLLNPGTSLDREIVVD